MAYIGVWGREIDVGIFGERDAASFSVGIVGSGEIRKVPGDPGINAKRDDDASQDEVDHQATAIGARTLVNYIRQCLPGTMGSFL